MTLLTAAGLEAALTSLPGWRLSDGKLAATFTFADFRAAFAFMAEVAAAAEQARHHPDWSNSYARVAIAFATHDEGGVTERDVEGARACKEIAQRHGGQLVPPPPPVAWPRDIPPLWFLGALLTMLLLHWTVPGDRAFAFPVRVSGACVAAVGLLLLLWSAGLFRRSGTGVRPFTPANVLVRRGPYRFTRNPMYLGMLAMLAGGAVALGSVAPLPVPPLFWLVIDRRFVCREEEFLTARFGAPYRDFCGRVRRWL